MAARPAYRRLLPVSLLVGAMLATSATNVYAISHRQLIAPTGAAASDYFGSSVSSAGDMNGDGYGDVVVGAHLNDAGGPDAGRAYVYYGGPGADDVADLTFTGAAASDNLGISVSSAGDVNGDGYTDVIVGAKFAAGAGSAYLYYGGSVADAVADLILTGAATNDHFGSSVSSAGDMNGDGYDDMIVGAPSNDAGGPGAGRAYVYFGGPGVDAAADLTLTGAVAGDSFGQSVSSAEDVNADGYADVIVGAFLSSAGGSSSGQAYVFHGGPGADAAADLTLTGEASELFGISVSAAGDVNGDGYGDVIVGAHIANGGMGRAYVFYGGYDAAPDITLTGTAAGELFGYSVSSAGDVNGDGYADVIVGAYSNDAAGADAGRAYLYFGGPWADAIADITLTGAATSDGFGVTVSSAEDANGDGYGDVIVGAYGNDAGGTDAGRAYLTVIYPYQVLSPNGGETWVSGAPGNVRWRGHDPADLAVSFDGGASWSTIASGVGGLEENEVTVIAPGPATDLARVRLTYSDQVSKRSNSDASDGVFRIVRAAKPPAAAHRLDRRFLPTAGLDRLGVSVSSAGDVNGDGYADVIVGADQNDAGGTDAGRAYVHFGGPAADTESDLTLTGTSANDHFGLSVCGAGDVNGDGYGDVLVGAPMNDAGGMDAGRAYVYFGGPAADTLADLILTGASPSDYFGTSVSSAADVNGDGYSDVIIGAYGNDAGGAGAGRAYVYYGGPVADTVADLTLTGAAASDVFGIAVSSAGDVNGDGYEDVIVGAWANDSGGTNAGRAYVYYGGPGADAGADLTFTGAAANDAFGYAASSAGDLNGDGYSDVIVGAFQNDAGGAETGRAYVYHGGPTADAVADLILTGVAAFDNFGRAVGSAGDVNGDGYADAIVGAPYVDGVGVDVGRVYLYYGGPGMDASADVTLIGAAASDIFGYSVSAAGDVNGDGYADVIAGALYGDAGTVDGGAAYVYDFNRYFVLSPNGGETWNVGAIKTISWLGEEPADVWLSVNGGFSYETLFPDAAGGSASNSVTIRVPHAPTKFAKIQVTPVNRNLGGFDWSDSTFTIQTSVSLLVLLAAPLPQGGASITWSTDPGPDDLAGYRLEHSSDGQAWSTAVALTRETSYTDPAGGPGARYRLFAVDGFGESLLLGETSIRPLKPLAAWPLPYRDGDLNVSFAIPGGLGGVAAEVDVSIFDVRGRLVKRLARGIYPQGDNTVLWNGRDEKGTTVASAIYFLRWSSLGEKRTLRLSVLR